MLLVGMQRLTSAALTMFENLVYGFTKSLPAEYAVLHGTGTMCLCWQRHTPAGMNSSMLSACT